MNVAWPFGCDVARVILWTRTPATSGDSIHAMALNMRQELRMSQQLVMTPQLQQAIKLLQLSRVELQDLVRGELLENPLLDDSQELGSNNDEPVSAVEMQDGLEINNAAAEAGSARQNEQQDQSELKVDDAPKDNFDWEAYLENNSYAPTTGPGVAVSGPASA